MYKKISMLLDARNLEGVKVEVRTYEASNGEGPRTVAIVDFDEDAYIQIRADALRGFIEKLEAAEAQISNKGQGTTEEPQPQSYVSDADRETIRERLLRNGTEL